MEENTMENTNSWDTTMHDHTISIDDTKAHEWNPYEFENINHEGGYGSKDERGNDFVDEGGVEGGDVGGGDNMDVELDEAMGEGMDDGATSVVGEGIRIFEHEEGEVSPLQRLLTAKLVDVQKLYNRYDGCWQTKQNYLLHNLLGTLERSYEHVESLEETFGDMFRRMPVTWKGELAGSIIPSSWKNLISMYKTLGMIEPLRWKLSVGTTNNIHDAFILLPNGEDCCNKQSDVLWFCNPPNQKIKQNCYDCSDKCPTSLTMKKDMILID